MPRTFVVHSIEPLASSRDKYVIFLRLPYYDPHYSAYNEVQMVVPQYEAVGIHIGQKYTVQVTRMEDADTSEVSESQTLASDTKEST
jgi:hypothetical protein